MGTGSHSKLAAPQLPARPFEKSRRLCWQEALLPIGGGDLVYTKPASSSKTTLQQLILRQDWQRVLIRANLYPNELRVPFRIHLYGVDLQVLPLHLILTLDPPPAVVELFLKHFVDATAMTIQPCATAGKQRTTKWTKRKHIQQKLRRWKERRQGSFPSVELGVRGAVHEEDLMYDHEYEEEEQTQHSTMSVEQRKSLIPQVARIPGEEESVHYSPPGANPAENYQEVFGDESTSSSPSIGSSLSSKVFEEEERGGENDSDDDNSTYSNGPRVILQLSPSGGLAPMPIVQKFDEETQSSSGSSGDDGDDDDDDKSKEVFRVEWDLDPLLQVVASKGELLPIHVACLFEASAPVLEALVRAYPLGALKDVVGMIPIHLVSAGWYLPVIFEPPPESSLAIMSMKSAKPGPLDALRVLRQAVPDSLAMKSENHGLTPQGYIEECMEDGDYKETCLHLLSEKNNTKPDYVHDAVSGSTQNTACEGSSAQSSTPNDQSLVAGLSSLILNENWAHALAMVEDNPQTAQKWYYGIEENDPSNTVWKRLPLHLACLQSQAPIGLMEVLLSAYPIGAALEDPCDGSLPLHMLCRAQADLSRIQRLLLTCPEATKAVDSQGRSALHLAVIHGAPMNVVQFLLQSDPESLVVADQSSKTPMDYAMESNDGALKDLLSMILKLLEKQSYHLMS